MKLWVLLIAIIAVLSLVGIGAAQPRSPSDTDWPGVITVYSTSWGACWVQEPEGGGIMNVYVIFESLHGGTITAAAFRLVTGGGFTGVYVGETVFGNVWLGNTQDGLEVALDGCYEAPRLLATVQYMTDGTSPSCSWLKVVGHPDPYYGAIVVVNCNMEKHEVPTNGKLHVVQNWANPDEDGCPLWCVSSSVEESTWGRVKALYTE